MNRRAQIDFLHAESQSMFARQLETSARYYSAEHNSREKAQALVDDAGMFSAVSDLSSLYGRAIAYAHVNIDAELRQSLEKLRRAKHDYAAELVQDLLSRLPVESVAA